MADNIEDGNEKLDLLRSLPIDDSADPVDALWRQLTVYKALAENDMSEARGRRAQAESARERAEEDSIDATRRLCERMKHDAEEALAQAQSLGTEAAKIMQEAESERSRARDATREAQVSSGKIVAEAQQRAQEVLAQARARAQQDNTDLRRQALAEIRSIMTRVEALRAATEEELETQRIFSNTARIKASSASAMSLLAAELSENASTQDGQPQLESRGANVEVAGHPEGSPVAKAPTPEAAAHGGPSAAEPAKPQGPANRGSTAKSKDKKSEK